AGSGAAGRRAHHRFGGTCRCRLQGADQPCQRHQTPTERACMIEFQNISKSYGPVTAIDGLSLKIERGEFVVLIGASGSGKSTMLKMINRMENHDAGRILLDGEEIYSFKVRELRLRMGYAIQSVGLFPHW